MDILITSVLAIFGLIIGSFLNVVILRWNTGVRISKGRSVCFSCNKTLEWYELVPLFSYVLQRARCLNCKTGISVQYPLVELLGAWSVPLAFYATPDVLTSIPAVISFVLTVTLFSFYIVLGVYDVRHKIIPDFFSYGAGLIALGLIAVGWYTSGTINMTQVIAGPSLFIFFWFFWFVSKGTWMGLGDAKLALSVGWVLGMGKGISAILLSFWIGSVLTLLYMALERIIHRKKALRMKSEIPFGPFILIGFFIAYIWNIDIQAILSFLAL